MRRCTCIFLVGTLCMTLVCGTLGHSSGAAPKANDDSTPATAAAREPQKAVERAKTDLPEVTVKLRDGTAIQCRLLTETVPVATVYGVLKVPPRELLVIYQSTPNDRNVDAAPNSGAERDIVVAREFTIPGRVTLDAYEVESSLGNVKIALEKIESLSRQPLNVPTLMLPVSVDTSHGFSREFENWRYSDAEEAGWLHPSFDDSQWKPVQHPPRGRGTSALTDTGSLTISPYTPGAQYYLRRSFLLMSQPKTASLAVHAKSYEVFVNGIRVSAGGEEGRTPQRISGALRRGINVIAVKATLLRAEGGILDVMMTAQ